VKNDGAIAPCCDRRKTGRRDSLNQSFRALLAALLVVNATGCAIVLSHQFTDPTNKWQSRSGQLMYRNARTTLIGEVLIRFSQSGDFELTFSKGPGVNLLVLRQNDSFAEVRGPLARMGWSGPPQRAPKQLRPWIALREKIIQAQDRKSFRYASGEETFLFRF
jgi:hypothetical protein